MRQDTRDFTQYPKKISLTDKAIMALWILFLISLGFASCVFLLTMPASAAEINPSVDNQPIQCRYSLTKWLCDTSKPGAQGYQGINGTPGLPGQPNFSAIYYNATNFTAFNNFTHFYNATAFNVTSNYTIFQGANFYNTTAINESYAYLPGREGGQILTGGTGANDDLILNGTSSSTKTSSYISLQPDGGNVGIGTLTPSSSLHIVAPYGLKIQDTSTNSATKTLAIKGAHYTNTEEEITALRLYSFGGYTQLSLGGSATNENSATIISFFTGKNPTTLTGTEKVRITSSGNLSVGGTSATAKLDDWGDLRIRSLGAGTVTADAGGNITSVSDAKAKTNVATYSGGLAQVLQLSPKSYKYSPDSGLDTKNTYVGFIAQDVEKVLPDAVKTKDDVKYEQKLAKKGATAEEDEYTTVEVKTGTQTKSLDDRAIIAALVNAVKEQQAEINALNERIKKLEATKT